jgi:hypothetical protein
MSNDSIHTALNHSNNPLFTIRYTSLLSHIIASMMHTTTAGTFRGARQHT